MNQLLALHDKKAAIILIISIKIVFSYFLLFQHYQWLSLALLINIVSGTKNMLL